MNLIRIIKRNFDALLLSLVLNINVLRVFLGITDTNLVLYMLYLLTILVLFVKYKNRAKYFYRHNTHVKKILFFLLYIIFFSFFSIFWSTYDSALITSCKFIVTLCLSYLCIYIPVKQLRSVMICFLAVNFVYGIISILNPDRVGMLLGDNMNYLNVTLTLGFSFCISLVFMTKSFFENRWKSLLIWGGLSSFFFVVLVGFLARGVLLFPPLIMLFLVFFMGREKRLKTTLIILLLVIVASIAISLFFDMVSDYGAARMMRLFEDTEDEDRFELWSQCSDIMIDNFWFVFGGGICAFSSTIYYPHNIFLQILGEYGILPFLFFIYMIYNIIKRFVHYNKLKHFEYRNELYFVISGLLYYLFTFCKSFSLYDALPLFIMMALSYSMKLGSITYSSDSN